MITGGPGRDALGSADKVTTIRPFIVIGADSNYALVNLIEIEKSNREKKECRKQLFRLLQGCRQGEN